MRAFQQRGSLDGPEPVRAFDVVTRVAHQGLEQHVGVGRAPGDGQEVRGVDDLVGTEVPDSRTPRHHLPQVSIARHDQRGLALRQAHPNRRRHAIVSFTLAVAQRRDPEQRQQTIDHLDLRERSETLLVGLEQRLGLTSLRFVPGQQLHPPGRRVVVEEDHDP